ncbi:MAG: hypothetical protein ABSF92_00485 [Candidatus Acidiferrales bacterium]|jgi:hypothetical protein
MKSRVLARWIKIGGLLALVAIGAVAALVATRWPFARDSVVAALQEKFSSAIELKTFRETYFTPGCVLEGATFRRNNDRTAPPIATIEKLTIQGSYWGFFTSPKRVRRVRIEGLRIFVSPSSERNGGEARPAGSLEQFAVIIGEIIADGAVVEFISGEPGTEPLKFEIHKLTLNSVADDRPMSFHATLQNPEPPGEIRTDGQFGPLRPEDVGHTFLSGAYMFQHADLGVFPGIGGTLASTGKFNGVLEHIEVEGDTDTPDFRVKRSDHAVHLKTQFHAMVNGMDGDVALQSVHAQFEGTSLVSHGEVGRKAGADAKTVSLEATELQGRIQDWLRLFSKAERPALTGAIKFRAQVLVPPGRRHFIERVNLQGDFGIDAMSFAGSSQEKVDSLSQVAQGEKENDNPASVVGNLKGHVLLKDAIATFPDLSFSVPGALAHVHGMYGLLTEQINLHGTLQVDNKLSKGSKGMRLFLLRFVEPFLKKKNAGEIVPIKIGGTFSHPSYGLDVVP